MLEELVNKLRQYNRIEVSYKTGLSLSTLNNLMCGKSTNPTIETVEKLNDFIRSKENELASQSK